MAHEQTACPSNCTPSAMSAAAATLSLVPPLTAGAVDERAASVKPAAAGVGKRPRRGEADTAGGAAQKKPHSVCPHQRQMSRCKQCGGSGICPHKRERSACKECGGEHLPAPAPKEQMQALRGGRHLPAPAHQERMQGVRGGEHLPAPAHQE